MKFTEIVEILRGNHNIALVFEQNSPEILKVKLWDGRTNDTDATTLFFSYDRQGAELPAQCILAGDPLDKTDLQACMNLAVIAPEDFVAAFNEAQDLVSRHYNNGYYDYLHDVADRVQNVDTLIDVASQSFGASLIFIDRDYRILSYSTQVPVTDVLWSENIRRGYCDYEFIQEVRNLKAIQESHADSTPMEVTCKSSPFRKLASRVYCKGTWIGSVLLIEGDDSYRPGHVEMLRALSNVLGYSVLTHSPELLYQTNEFRSFLYNLIIGAPLDTQPEAYRKLQFQDGIKLLYFKAGRGMPGFPREAEMEKRILGIVPSCHVISHRENAIVIGSVSDLSDPERLLEQFPAESCVQVGISRNFRKIEDLHKALDEARDALKTGRDLSPDRKIFSFEEYGVYVMLRNLSREDDISRYYHSSFNTLIEYDENNEGSLLSTLQAYLRANGSIKDTSEMLFMHRNSVIYRLKKIEDLTGVDLNDPGTCFRLRLSFAIYRLEKNHMIPIQDK